MALPTTQTRSWTRNGCLISTDASLIPLQDLNKAFDSDQLDWAMRLPIEELQVMVDSSVCFGLYAEQGGNGSRPLIGFARIVTDKVTLAYLTDVYILPEHQDKGLGSWLIDCVKEWLDLMPYMRQLVLLSRQGKNEQYYARKLGTGPMEKYGTDYRFFNRKGPGSALGSHD